MTCQSLNWAGCRDLSIRISGVLTKWLPVFQCICTHASRNVHYVFLSHITAYIRSLLFSRQVEFDSLLPHGLQHARLPCPSPSPAVCPIHVHWAGDAIQPSHPLLLPSPSAFSLTQHHLRACEILVPWPGIEPSPLGMEVQNLNHWKVKVKVTQLCLTLCNPMFCSPPGSSVHGILQARILEWAAVPFSRGSSQPRDWTQVSHITGRFFTSWATKEAP